jgi:hypothetical protein
MRRIRREKITFIYNFVFENRMSREENSRVVKKVCCGCKQMNVLCHHHTPPPSLPIALPYVITAII